MNENIASSHSYPLRYLSGNLMKISHKLTESDKEFYVKLADCYSDEPEPVKKSKAKKVIIATAVTATATSSALFGLK